MLHALPGGGGGRGAALSQDACAIGVPDWWFDGCDNGVSDGDLDQCMGLSTEYCRPAIVFVACVHHSGVRVDDSLRRVFGGARDDRAKRSAAALSSGLQRAEL